MRRDASVGHGTARVGYPIPCKSGTTIRAAARRGNTRALSKRKGKTMTSKDISRRGWLTSGLAAAIGVAVSAVLPKAARAANGDALTIGQANTGTEPTTLTAAVPEEDSAALVVDNNAVASQTSLPNGVRGEGYFGVYGVGKGMHTWAGPPPPDPHGVVGAAYVPEGGRGVGVSGGVYDETGEAFVSSGVGVAGTSITESEAAAGFDIGETDGMETPSGIGVLGMGSRRGVVGTGPQVGVFGRSPAVGVRAESPAGVALDVRGKAQFSNSGRGTIAAGASNKLVTGAKLTANSTVLVTLQGNAGPGVHVQYVLKVNSTSFKVFLNKPAARNVIFGWFIVN